MIKRSKLDIPDRLIKAGRLSFYCTTTIPLLRVKVYLESFSAKENWNNTWYGAYKGSLYTGAETRGDGILKETFKR
jgi:hypothetical protein